MKRIFAAAALPLIMLSSCSLKDYKYTTKSDSVDIEVDTEKVTAVKLSNDVGDIDISYGEGNTAKIHVDYKFRGIKEEAVSDITEAIDNVEEKTETAAEAVAEAVEESKKPLFQRSSTCSSIN